MINMKKILSALFILGLVITTTNMTTHATTTESQIEQFTSNNNINVEEFKSDNIVPEGRPLEEGENWTDNLITGQDILAGSNITFEEFENRVLSRMLDIVSLFQTFAKPFCIILFILCALGVLMSIVFNTNKQKTFILGLMLSVIAYVGVIFAPDLVLFFANWLSA